MLKVSVLVLSLWLVVGPCLATTHSLMKEPGRAWRQFASAEDAGWSSAKLAAAKAYAESIQSAGFLLVQDGAVVTSWGDIETRYLSASMRKAFLSSLYGIYVNEGKINLRRTLAELGIDDIAPALTPTEQQATVADLLTSRSGVYHTAAFEPASHSDARPARGSHAPGTFWHYNNWDFNALLTIFEQQTGKRIFEEFEERIARPLQMQDFRLRDGYYLFEKNLSQHPAYPFRLSARDLARFGLLYLNKGSWNGKQLVPADWVRESTRAQTIAYDDYGFGYMWWTLGGDFKKYQAFATTGVGVQMIVVLPALNAVFVHVANNFAGTGDVVVQDKVLDLLRRVLDAKGTDSQKKNAVGSAKLIPMPERNRQQKFIKLPAELLKRYAQTYTLPSGMKVPMQLEQGELVVETRIGRFALHPLSTTEFVTEDMGQHVFFDSSSSSKTLELIVEPLWLREGQTLLRRGEVQSAIEIFQRLTKFYPNSFPAHVGLGDACLKAERKAEAIASYRKALALRPQDKGVLEKLRQLGVEVK